MTRTLTSASVAILSFFVAGMSAFEVPQPAAPQPIDLGQQLTAGKLKAVNREVTPASGDRLAIHVSEKEGPGVVWLAGSDFAEGTIELEVKGRDLLGRSFLGVAFHGKEDNTYEAVYVRPFNFRADDPARHQHAVQYMASPDFDWPRLRKEFAEEFENPVDPSVVPTDWVPLRVVVKGPTVQIFVGAVKAPTLEARKLGTLTRGMLGLWVGNGSDGDFRNLRVTESK
jgi:hypothetical protein